MSTETNIRTLEVDSNSIYRTQRIKLSSTKCVTTPTKTIPLDRIKLKNTLNPESRQLNEIFKRFTADKIQKANEDTYEYNKLETWFNSQNNKKINKDSTFCIIDFNEMRLPTDDEIEFMADIAYCNSDITTIPTINHFNTPKQTEIDYDNFKKYLSNSIETIEQFNNKPIMGIIPKLAPKKVEDLMNFYYTNGINSFLIDLAGSNPISSSMRIFKVLKNLNKMKILENCYLHGHNVGMRVNKTTDVIPAKDILGFGVGLSSLGEKRNIFKPNRNFIEFIKTNPMNKFRLFNKNDYGYWKGVSVDELNKICPKDCSLDLKDFNNPTQMSHLQKVFNVEQLALESHNLKNIITEDADKSLDYIKNKKHIVKDDVSLLEKGKKKIK